jgi:hypothetical protein
MIIQTASFDPGTRTDVHIICDVIGGGDDDDNDDCDLLIVVTVLGILCV